MCKDSLPGEQVYVVWDWKDLDPSPIDPLKLHPSSDSVSAKYKGKDTLLNFVTCTLMEYFITYDILACSKVSTIK